MSKNQITNFYLKNKEKIEIAISVASSFTDFAITKSPFSFIRGGLQAMNIFFGAKTAGGYFNEFNGWDQLTFDNCRLVFSLYENALSKFPSNSIKTDWGGSIRIIQLPIGEIGVVEDQDEALFYRANEDPDYSNKLIDFINNQLLSSMKHPIVAIENQTNRGGYSLPKLINQEINAFPSKIAIQLEALLQKAIDQKRNRSFLLYGPPGTGKSAIANYLISKFNFRTLRIDSKNFTSTSMRSYFKMFKFDAILIDDLDRFDEDSSLLLFLEEAKRHCKLIVATCNSLSKFSAAVRPGRFDQLFVVESLDEETIKSILGPLEEKWFEKVKHFPAAYLKEFVDRSFLYPEEELENHFQELNERVDKQIKEIKDE